MRATAVAIVFVLTSLIGLGLGPVLVGSLSDIAAARAAETATRRESSFAGLTFALAAASLLYLWPAIHYFMASRSVAKDLRSR